MDFCIIGLLLMLPRSSYELRQAFAQSLGLFYSSSLGAIQASMKKLASLGYIELASEERGGRGKKTWRATALGTSWFYEAMHSPLPENRLEETALARLHFLGLVREGADRCAILTLIISAIESATSGLDYLKSQYDTMPVPEEWKHLQRYQMATLDYGLDSHRHGLAWFRNFLEQERRSCGAAGKHST
jgi:DNA-binding PadR family transcriptional regulator